MRVYRVNYTFDVSKKGSRLCRQYEERSLMSEVPETFDVSKTGNVGFSLAVLSFFLTVVATLITR